MSFRIQFYTNKSRNNKRKKDLTQIMELEGVLRDKTSIQDPVILIETDEDLKKCNYMHIAKFGRYYYINDIISVRNDLYEIHAHCDVLMSAGDDLDNCIGIVRRQERKWNLYLDDGVFKSYSNPNIVQKSFPSGFNLSDSTYILAIAGS